MTLDTMNERISPRSLSSENMDMQIHETQRPDQSISIYISDQENRNQHEAERESSSESYVYRDYSRVLNISEQKSCEISNWNPSDVKKNKLPTKLDAMLSDPEFSDVISWLPHGRSWQILRPKGLANHVLTRYFDNSNYNSFIRLVNAWGFRRFRSGPDRHSYYHELFLRDLPHLHKKMRRLTKKDKKEKIDQDDEPDFYDKSQFPPLSINGHDAPTVSLITSFQDKPENLPSTEPRIVLNPNCYVRPYHATGGLCSVLDDSFLRGRLGVQQRPHDSPFLNSIQSSIWSPSPLLGTSVMSQVLPRHNLTQNIGLQHRLHTNSAERTLMYDPLYSMLRASNLPPY